VAARFAPAFEVEGRRLEPGPCGAHVSADRRLVQQALTNLVANALEHGEGTVRVGARRQDHDVEVVVSDDGAGPEPELMARATQRFVRGPASTGAGLGLSIVTAIAEAHAGRCGIRHVEGGTEAWLTLPLVVPGSPSSGLAR
jgi:signal transduction histidine kinase